MAMSTNAAPGFIRLTKARGMSFGAWAPGIKHRADHQIGVDDRFFDVGAVRHQRRDMTAEDIVHVAQLGWIDVENADIGAHAGGDLAGRGAGHAGAEDDHIGRAHARGAAEQNSASAVFRLQTPGADLDRQPSGDLAHGREQRQRAVVELNGFVGDCR